jgi:iron(III) transport system substrate-binding protein
MSKIVKLASVAALLLTLGCVGGSRDEVVVFSALDREFSEPILQDFQRVSGTDVRSRFDVESTKTVQLVARIVAEKRPTCDVFWNNEILHTLRLQQLGLLEAYQVPNAADFPANYRSPDGLWYGLAARARVLIVNTELVPPEHWPDSVRDLTDPVWKDQVGMAKPLYGTTATHAAVLFSIWGDEQARAFFRHVKKNAQILSGNKQVATAVGRGQLAFGITDTDDAIIEKDQGRPVAIVFPDQGAGQEGALFIPNTVAIIKNCRHPDAARRLIDSLLEPQTEIRLAAGSSAQFPVNRTVDARSRALPEKPPKWLDVDFQAAADRWETTMEFLQELYIDPS